MHKIAVFSVIFPGNLSFFQSFLRSLEGQTIHDFDLLLVVDGVPDIETHITKYKDSFKIQCLATAGGSIATVRELGFKWVETLSYEKIIFADTDDLLANDRIFKCAELLDAYPLVVSDLSPFSNEKEIRQQGYWNQRMENGSTFTYEDILLYNFVGLGNSAVRKEVVRSIFIPPATQIVDWFVFYNWMLTGKVKGVFAHAGQVLYRQHDLNQAGAKRLTPSRLLNVVNTKLDHYSRLVTDNGIIAEDKKHVERLKQRMQSDVKFLDTAVEKLNEKTINYFWWEETQYLHE